MDVTEALPPPPEASEENGGAAAAPEGPADPDNYSTALATVSEQEDLPADFERLWKAAHDNPQDFPSWTDLLQYCEHEVCVFSKAEGLFSRKQKLRLTFCVTRNYHPVSSFQGHAAAYRRALEAFLVRYPLCYGYWKKFVDLERRGGDNNIAEEVKTPLQFLLII